MTWTPSLVARFFSYRRTLSSTSTTTPLISCNREGYHPISSYSALDSVPVLQRLDGEQLSSQDESDATKVTSRPSPGSHPAVVHVHDVEAIQLSGKRSIRAFFMEELETARAVAPLSAYCFMTGFMDAISFSALFVWCAFQTGNSLQLSFALARLASGHAFQIADQQALCAVLCFVFGAFVGRIGDKIGCKTRAWMTLGTLIQTLFTMVAAIAIWKSGSRGIGDFYGEPAWRNSVSFVTLGFMSASMGLQGVMGKRLNTQFTTTVVLTATWCDLVTEPQLFDFRHLVPSRDHKAMAIVFLFVGGFAGRMILDQIGSAATLGVGASLRFVIALSWLLVPAKKVE